MSSSEFHKGARDNKWLRALPSGGSFIRIYCDDANEREEAAALIAAVTVAPGAGLTLHRGNGGGGPLRRGSVTLVPCRCPAGPHRVDHSKVQDLVDANVRVARASQVAFGTSTP